MLARMIWGASLVVTSMSFVACGGSGRGGAGSSSTTPGSAPSSASPAAKAEADAGPSAVDAAVPRPFAKTSLEATQLIDAAISSRQKELDACAQAARSRRKDPHAKIVMDIGIDSEGTFIGV